jgi:hypothetical protein
MARHVVNADRQNLAAGGVNLVAYRLKDGQFVRSTARKITRVEPDNKLGSAQPTQRHILTGMRG